MKLKAIPVYVIISLLLISCTEENLINDNFEIKYGSTCGWCAGQEFITITNDTIKYMRNIPCGEDKIVIKGTRKLNLGEWNKIISSFDYSIFKTLEYTDCNVCADGCDEILEISEDDSVHKLSYTPSTEIEEVKKLRNQLSEIMDEMRNID